jgi:phage terminase small subunit
MQKTLAQLQSDWVVQGKISSIQSRLASEQDPEVRKQLEVMLEKARAALSPD